MVSEQLVQRGDRLTMAKRGWDLRNVAPQANFRGRLIRTWLEHSLELKGYALRIENMPIPVKRGSNKPAQRKGSQVTRRVARKWIGRAHAGTWGGRAWLPAQAPRRSRTMGFWLSANSFSARCSVAAPRNCLGF